MAITAQMVKELRDATGLGMMDCKEALNECAGDMEKAIEYLRKKGLKVASKRGDRASKEGVIDSYIHLGGKIGVMVELNCETDFVARTQDFKDLAREISMQIAAADVIEKESSIYTEQTLAEGKPEKVVPKIVEGKLKRFYEDVCLLEQSYIRDQDKKVSDILSAAIAKTGEMVRVRRFVRYVLGQE
jgi:elongation factor Ts